jgi:hypothetical protein
MIMETKLVFEILGFCVKLIQPVTQEDIITCSLYEGFKCNMPLDSIENKTVAFSLQANCSE